MLKKVYIVSRNHMDPTWRRAFEDHFYYQDNVMRPYSDIEEFQFTNWIEIMKNSKCTYEIEQSLTIRKYLEKNPDAEQLFKELVKQDRIIHLGGGEAIIDYNMVDGEAIVRNHLYSILWCKDFLGKAPVDAVAHDTFGLSAQLPQIINKLGYKALIGFCRVFKDHKPFWKGLNGDIVFFNEGPHDLGLEDYSLTDTVKTAACSSCKGEGCNVCDYKGLDDSFCRNLNYNRFEPMFRSMSESENNEFILTLSAEESRYSTDITKYLENYSEKYNIELNFLPLWDVIKKTEKKYLADIENNSIDEKDIDDRIEGNPVCTGCYVSRIAIKKMNRELEDLLLSCEKFAVFASDFGMLYPRKKIEALWNLVAFIQFHDGITSSHCDAGYEEIKRKGREVSLGAANIYKEAMTTIEKNIDIPAKEGYESFVIFNPLSWNIKNNIFETVINLNKAVEIEKIIIEDTSGNPQQIIGIEKIKNHFDNSFLVKFKGNDIPSIGYKVYYYKLNTTMKSASSSNLLESNTYKHDYIENEYYKINVNDHCISNIYDKKLGEYILNESAGSLFVQQDIGSVWETLTVPTFTENISSPMDIIDNPKNTDTVSVKIKSIPGKKTITIEGSYFNPIRKINKIIWDQTITLYDGIKKVFFKTNIDWDTVNNRIMVFFPLTFKTPSDEAYYEIPYGTLKRNSYTPQYGEHTLPNGDWPALNFVSCYNDDKDYNVTLINKGLPCYQVKNGVIKLSILRSPDELIWAFDMDKAKDTGKHSFEYAITSNKGKLKEGSIVQQGKEFNTKFLSVKGNFKKGALNTEHSFLSNESSNVIISSVKLAQKNDSKIIRGYEAYGNKVDDKINNITINKAYETNLLEEDEKEISEISYDKFEIKTIKIV